VQNLQQQTNWLLKANHQNQSILMQAINPPQLPDNKICQLWITTTDGTTHSLGVLPHSGSVQFSTKSKQTLLSFDAKISVTIEDKSNTIKSMPSEKIVSQGKWLKI
jgi:anti-sigma-K factor RskA